MSATPRPLPFNRLLIGAGGGIACSLLPAWITWLQQHFNVETRVVLTRGAERLVSAKALAVLTRAEVLIEEDAGPTGSAVRHIAAARWADAVLVAPATANLVGKLAHGIADDLVSTVVLATEAPTVIAPALTPTMASRPATRRNLDTLSADGYCVLPTGLGVESATGDVAAGAMVDAPVAVGALARLVRERLEVAS